MKVNGKIIGARSPGLTEVTSDSLASFGELLVAENQPELNLKFPYNINTDIVEVNTSGAGTVTQSDSMAVLSTGASTSSDADFSSLRKMDYTPGQGVDVRFTALFTTGVAGSIQEIGLGTDENGLFFGYSGADFMVCRRADSVDEVITQDEFNIDKIDGTGPSGMTIDTTKGNVYRIQYQWLGYGQLTFYVEDPNTGRFMPVHAIEYANANTSPSFADTTLALHAKVENTTNNTDIVLKTASMGAYRQGARHNDGPINSIFNIKAGIGSTATNVLTIRNKTTFASASNRTPIRLQIATAALAGTAQHVVDLVLNTTLGGTPSYTDISTSTSVIEYDTAGTTLTGGNTIFSFVTNASDTREYFLEDLRWELIPGDTLTVAVRNFGGTSATGSSLTWRELF